MILPYDTIHKSGGSAELQPVEAGSIALVP